MLAPLQGFPGGSDSKQSTCNAGDPGLIPGLGRPPGKGNSNPLHYSWASWLAQRVKASAGNAGDLGSIPGLGRSPGEGNGNPLQYSCLENPMYGEAWWATVMGSQRVGHN